jgi:hypothetical protein
MTVAAFLAPEDLQRRVVSVVRLEGQPLGVEIGLVVTTFMIKTRQLPAARRV